MIESLFYAGTTPWHGLGEKVDSALSSDEALKKAGLNWIVEQRPIVALKDKITIPIQDYVANVRTTDNRVLGVVSTQYKIVQNHEAFSFTDSLLGEGVKYETAGSLAQGKQVWLLARMPETKILDDPTVPYLVFTNSHDGKGAVRVAITPIRVVCMNTLNLALREAQRSWSTIHMGNIETKMEEAKRTLGLANDYLKALGEEASILVNKEIPDKVFTELVEELFPFGEDITPRQKETIIEMRTGLEYKYKNTPDLDKYRNTAWGVINAVSDFATHRKPKRNTSTYQENLFKSVINGHPLIDKAYELLKVA